MPRFRKPSPALALAFIALLVSLSSSAGANPVAFVAKAISGTTIKKHSIPLSALSASAVKALHGATGARGLPGARGAAGATNLKVVVGQGCTPDGCTQAAVACPAGSVATGGGGLVASEVLYESRPVFTNNVPIGWEVAGAASQPNHGSALAYAVCASP
jgi:hypothetical protein